ncbi:MAG: ABC transporter permease [Deltaproteobacteria bacterium]|nr:ABC transporter permease [Deltaproteobacteria bacterium]
MSYIFDGFRHAIELILTANPETMSAMWATIRVSSLSIAASLAIGVPAGFVLGHTQFPGRKSIRTVVETLLALPTVVIGLLVYTLLSKQGPAGEWGLLFTLPGIAIGQTILGVPVITALTATAVESLDSRLAPTLLTLGARKRHLLLTSLWEARFAVLIAGITAYGRIVSEVGISMMVGGNIKWHTRTLTTTIALETGKGEFAMGIALGLVLIVMAFAVNISLAVLKRRTAR